MCAVPVVADRAALRVMLRPVFDPAASLGDAGLSRAFRLKCLHEGASSLLIQEKLQCCERLVGALLS